MEKKSKKDRILKELKRILRRNAIFLFSVQNVQINNIVKFITYINIEERECYV